MILSAAFVVFVCGALISSSGQKISVAVPVPKSARNLHVSAPSSLEASLSSFASALAPATAKKSGRPPTTPVPPGNRKTFFIDTSHPINRPVARAMRMQGWRRVENMEEAQVLYSYGSNKSHHSKLAPWQRYNHVPKQDYQKWNHKNEFNSYMQKYERESGSRVWTLPETYRFDNEDEVRAFEKRLAEGGLNLPWVLKQPNINQGKGVTMLGPQTEDLKHVVENVRKRHRVLKGSPMPIVQKFILNELTFDGRKFDFRVFWMVASLDPLVLLYHDGYVRVGNSNYDEKDFSNTRAHLTTHTGLAAEGKGTWDDLRQVVEEHHAGNQSTNPALQSISDPMIHITKQVKQALGQMAAAFRDTAFHARHIGRAENGFGFYGADFILDEDLDVWFIEPQNGCGLDEDWQFRIEMHNGLFGDMINVVEEVAERQEAGLTLDNLQRLGGYEVVYNDGWVFEYEGYTR